MNVHQKNTEPALMSLTSVAKAIAQKRISSREATRSCLDRIAQWQPRLNAFFDHREQRHEGGIKRVVGGADGATEHHHQRWRDGIRRFNARKADVEITDRTPTLAEHQFETAKIFEVHVANGQNFLIHQPLTSRLTGDLPLRGAERLGGRRRPPAGTGFAV